MGQLVVQLLVASGVQVIGLDPDQDRCRLAEKTGALVCAAPDDDGAATAEKALSKASGGFGADRVFLVAGGSSNQPVELAARLARDRATVVDIGKCKLDLPWNDYYEKELDLRFSRSYGPGRYDPNYELNGVDYPVGYVRWTERRNLHCFINAVARKEIDPEPLISGIFPLEDATDVYGQLSAGSLRGVGYLFEYDSPAEAHRDGDEPAIPERPARTGTSIAFLRSTRRTVTALCGSGSSALATMPRPCCSRTSRRNPGSTWPVSSTRRSLSAVNAQRKFGFQEASTDTDALLEDPSIDAVFIVTRHSSHADLTCQALEAGKAVFVEKPLALTPEELDRILATVDATGNDRLMVGFNRRFAPLLVDMRKRFGRSSEPTSARYLVNAGRLASDSWYRDAEHEGSRFVGEGGHFIDTLSWWIGGDPVEVMTLPAGGGEELQVSLRYGDGSLATITYLTEAHRRFPKETFEASSGGRTARLDNFRRATVWSGAHARARRHLGPPDKGQRAQIAAFLFSLRTGGPMPISLESLTATTRATLAATAGVALRTPQKL